MIEVTFCLENGDSGAGSQSLSGLGAITGQDLTEALGWVLRHLEQVDIARRLNARQAAARVDPPQVVIAPEVRYVSYD